MIDNDLDEGIVICPKCGKRISVDHYDIINADKDLKLKEKILNMTINHCVCKECGYKIDLDSSFMYADDKNKIAIVKTNYIDLVTKDREIRDYVKSVIGNDYKAIGARDLDDLRNKILLIDAGYDYRIGQLLLLSAYRDATTECRKILLDKEKKEFYFPESTLMNMENNLVVLSGGYDPFSYKSKCFYSYDIKDLDEAIEFYKKFLPILDDIGSLLFDLKAAEKLVSIKREDIENLKKAIYKFGVIKKDNGLKAIAYICPFNSSEIEIGDVAYIIDHDEPKKVKILETFNMSDFKMPYEINDLPFVGYKLHDFEINSINKDIDQLDNLKILDNLVKYKKSGYRMNLLDYPELDKLEVIAGFETNSSKANSTILYHKEDKVYLTMYTSKEKIVDDQGYDLKVYKFLDILKVIYYCPELCDGIVINPGNEEIIMSKKTVFHYKSERCLANSELMKKLLPILTDEEINFLGAEKYRTICKVYLENKTPKDIIKEENITDKEIDHRLSEGYGRLRRIYECNY